jgi:hypothetical protein
MIMTPQNEVFLLIRMLTETRWRNIKRLEAFINKACVATKLPRLEMNGKLIKASNTTTKRTQITIEAQLRWMALVSDDSPGHDIDCAYKGYERDDEHDLDSIDIN